MDLELLTEPHNLNEGDSVVVTERVYPNNFHRGTIYKIINEPISRYKQNSPYVDYFYIKFDIDTLDSLCMRGLPIIYKHRPAILGYVIRSKTTKKIEQIYTQDGSPVSSREEQINLNDINAVLVWRVAYSIKPMNKLNGVCPVSNLQVCKNYTEKQHNVFPPRPPINSKYG